MSFSTSFPVDFTGFTAAGFRPVPTAGQLDSDFWRIEGFSDNAGLLNYGDTAITTGDYARGILAGDPTEAGIYAVNTGITGLGTSLVIQGTASEFGFPRGTITLRVQYTGSSKLTALDFAYDGVYRNNGDRAMGAFFSFAVAATPTQPDATSFGIVGGTLDFDTPVASTSGAPWVRVPLVQKFAITSINPNDYIFLRWTIGELGGAVGERDEIGLDNISLSISNFAPTGNVQIAFSDPGSLTASNTLADGNGLGTITYQWQKFLAGSWVDIASGTGSSFTPTADLAGQELRAEARYTDLAGNPEAVASTTTAFFGTSGNNALNGNGANNIVAGLAGDDSLNGGTGNDTLIGGVGNDTVDGGDGTDLALLAGTQPSYRFGVRDGVVITSGTDGLDQFTNVENFQWGTAAAVSFTALLSSPSNVGLVFASFNGAPGTYVLADAYTGPVAGLVNQQLGSTGGDIMLGTGRADFINGGAGDDAIDGGAGNDVLDGGAGSNFLTGGAGVDTFFVEGRAAAASITWNTITDFTAGETVTIWGYVPGVSTVIRVANDGVGAFKGATLHWDLDGNGVTDTSVTFTGLTLAQVPTPTFGTISGQDYVFIG